jgi:hypothetical protein
MGAIIEFDQPLFMRPRRVSVAELVAAQAAGALAAKMEADKKAAKERNNGTETIDADFEEVRPVPQLEGPKE